MFESVVIYFTSFLISVFAAKQYQLLKNSSNGNGVKISYNDIYRIIWASFSIGIPVLLATLRSESVGTDYRAYNSIFSATKMINPLEYANLHFFIDPITYRLEIGFHTIGYISYSICDSTLFYSFLCELIIMIFIWKGAEFYSSYYNFSFPQLLFFFYLLDYLHGYSVVRFSMIVAIFFWAFQYVIKKEFLKYFFCLLLAMTIHKTAIICLFFYLFNIIELRPVKFYAVIIVPVIMGGFLYSLGDILLYVRGFEFLEYANEYSAQTNDNKIFSAVITSMLFLLPMVYYYRRLMMLNRSYMLLLMVGLMYLPFNWLGYYNFFFTRMGRLPELIICVLICILFNSLKKNITLDFWKLYYYGYIVALHFSIFFIHNDISNLYPYSFISV